MFRSALLIAVLTAASLQVASAATVLAHFMVQNAYAYDQNEWEKDMRAAQQIGIDGFALNWIPPYCQSGLDWTIDRIDDAFHAAEATGFKLVYSFDMSYSVCNTFWTTDFMQQMIEKYAGSSATYRWNSNILVTTYGGDQVAQYGNQFFQTLKNNMKSTNAITLAPALTTYSMGAQYNAQQYASKLVTDYSSVDGYLNWQAWPLNRDSNITVTPDTAFQNTLKNSGRTGPYIMAVSPWQYKDLNNGNPLDAWVAYSDTLFPDRFQQLTGANDLQPDIIELLSWNDFCESHYIRDLPSTNPADKDFIEMGDMANYVNGQNHSPWRIIAKYYISWWKTGTPPAITMDQVIFWHRIHPKDVTCSAGSTIRNDNFPQDAVFAWALVKSPATISMTVGANQYWTFEADGSGPVMNMVPFPAITGDVTPEVAIMRNGQTVYDAKSSQAITNQCDWQNFNPVVTLVGQGRKNRGRS